MDPEGSHDGSEVLFDEAVAGEVDGGGDDVRDFGGVERNEGVEVIRACGGGVCFGAMVEEEGANLRLRVRFIKN